MLSRRHVHIVLLAAALALLAGCKVQLYADLDERDANAILGALLEKEVRAEKRPGEEGLYIIMVEEEDFPRAQRITERLNLPHPTFASLGTVFAKTGMVSNPLEEGARMNFAITQQLSETLYRFDGVVWARVHVTFAQTNDLGEVISPASASVFIKYNDSPDFAGELVSTRIDDIKRLVAGAVQGVHVSHVEVVASPTDLSLPPPPKAPLKWYEAPRPLRLIAAAVLAFAFAFGVTIAWRGRRKRKE